MNVTVDGIEYTDLTEDQQRHASAIARLQEQLHMIQEQRENAMISLQHRESELARSLKQE